MSISPPALSSDDKYYNIKSPCITLPKKCLELRSAGLTYSEFYKILIVLLTFILQLQWSWSSELCWSKSPVNKKGRVQSKLSLIWKQHYNLYIQDGSIKTKTFRPISPLFSKIVFRPEVIPLHSIVLLDFQNNMEILGQTTGQQVMNMPVLNWNNKGLHCKEVLLLNESPFEHTKLH